MVLTEELGAGASGSRENLTMPLSSGCETVGHTQGAELVSSLGKTREERWAFWWPTGSCQHPGLH